MENEIYNYEETINDTDVVAVEGESEESGNGWIVPLVIGVGACAIVGAAVAVKAVGKYVVKPIYNGIKAKIEERISKTTYTESGEVYEEVACEEETESN